jgi:hypothetical protein
MCLKIKFVAVFIIFKILTWKMGDLLFFKKISYAVSIGTSHPTSTLRINQSGLALHTSPCSLGRF